MFRTIGEIQQAELDGKFRDYMFRKTPTIATVSNIWFDLSMSSGMPTPKYWFDAEPLVAKLVTQSSDGGFYHGPNVSPSIKYLRKITTQSYANSGSAVATPMSAYLLDYIMYYPTIDDGTTDEQIMDNTVTLPRYEDGSGVMMLAITTGTRVGGQSFSVKYTNQDGVTGRVTPSVIQHPTNYVGGCVQGGGTPSFTPSPFLPLQDGDSGVRAIESVTMNGTDIGLFSIILVKPLAHTCFRDQVTGTTAGIGVPHENDVLISQGLIPRIYDDSFLNFVVFPQQLLSNNTIQGSLKVIWT